MEVTGWTYWHEPEELSNCGFEDSILNSRDWWQKASQIVVAEVRKHNYHFTGSMHQDMECCVPIIDGKYLFQISQRSWGQLMADAYPNEDYSQYESHSADLGEPKGSYNYLKWAWTSPSGSEVILPP